LWICLKKQEPWRTSLPISGAAPIGKRAEIIAKIIDVVPDADFSDPAWGTIQGQGWSIELNMGTSEDCKSFAFHIRGRREAANVVGAVLDHLKLRAVDAETGEFFRTKPAEK
jgi:hypothetical protein